jgi:hypothetical protein
LRNVILRPVYNRPEMLTLSIEAEIRARSKFELCDFITLFLVEHGSPQRTLDLISSYPYSYDCIFRDKKYGLTVNILEGMKSAFSGTESFILHLEDDILLHETYFEYISVLFRIAGDKFSVLSPYCSNDAGDVHEVNKHNHYAALAPIISKEFFNEFIKPNAIAAYYRNPAGYVINLNNRYKEYWGSRKYKYRDAKHHEQAGLINRLVDVAIIEDDRYIFTPQVNRQQHIGYFGKNRPGGILPGNNYEERLSVLRKIVLDADMMYAMSATKQYNDYLTFSPKLEDWNGSLFLGDYKGTAK